MLHQGCNQIISFSISKFEMTDSNRFPDCDVCQQIWQAFSNLEVKYRIALTFEDIAKVLPKHCPRHDPLLGGRQIGPLDEFRTIEGKCLFSSTCHKHFLLAKPESDPEHVGTGRILDPEWCDTDILRRWKDRCHSLHGDRCSNYLKTKPMKPAWLIDVEQMCLVPGENGESFVALSYRWGNASFQANMETLEILREKDSLISSERHEDLASLPPILYHAMHVTSVIGERYLWIDALCIIHGSPSTADQLNMMGALYASAVVTIIAADGDAFDGLQGLKGVSNSRKLQQNIVPFGEEKIVMQSTHFDELIKGSPYFERGWTYQEQRMATRKIFFKGNQLHWECQCSEWHEESTLGSELWTRSNDSFTFMTSGIPMLSELSDLFRDYNKRHLRYDQDALAAILGTLSIMSRTYGGFLYGLPEMFFDKALAWNPYHDNIRRRVPSTQGNNVRLSDSELPSWSWIGWQGQIDFGKEEIPQISEFVISREETFPITTWYTGKSPQDKSPRKIKSTWSEDRASFKESNKEWTRPLLPGWTRHNGPPFPKPDSYFLYPDGCGEYYYTHCNLPNDDRNKWCYPFPVQDIQHSTPIHVQEQTAYLFAQTKTACLWARQTHSRHLEIFKQSGVAIGQLYHHNEEQKSLFPEVRLSHTKEGKRCLVPVVESDLPGRPVDLVEISGCRSYDHAFDSTKVSEKYNVLWIEWEGDIAYRLASGWVKREEWEALELQDISLILG